MKLVGIILSASVVIGLGGIFLFTPPPAFAAFPSCNSAYCGSVGPTTNCTCIHEDFGVTIHTTCGQAATACGRSCGNGICSYPESCASCQNDCGICGDSDGDLIIDASDNCPAIYNAGQEDCDGDGTGDVCDSENGIFAQATSYDYCYIRLRWSTIFVVSLMAYEEALYEDTSSCGAPDKWVKRTDPGGCFGGHTGRGCCETIYPVSSCNQFWRNDQCH